MAISKYINYICKLIVSVITVVAFGDITADISTLTPNTWQRQSKESSVPSPRGWMRMTYDFYQSLLDKQGQYSAHARLLKSRISRFHFAQGYHYFDRGELPDARRSFARAITHSENKMTCAKYLLLF